MTNGGAPVTGAASLGQRLRDLLGTLYPLHCLACGCQVTTGEALCPPCREALSRGPARCPRCAGSAEEGGRPCLACRNRPPPMGATLAPLAYREPVADWLRACKYRNQPGLAGPLATLVTAEASRWLGDYSLRQPVLIPVPLHRRRLAQRGYNQAGLLARQWGRQLGIPVRHGALRRVRPTAAQAELGGRERRRNVRGAFRARGLAGREVVLVDDVVTSGATVEAAAEALLAAGATEVRVLAVARAGLDRAAEE